MQNTEIDSRWRCRPRTRRKRGAQAAQAGTSLIEIMVVLVILLIGVFLAIRIFPAGLATLATTENRGTATHLAQQTLGDTVSNAANLPGGIYAATVTANSSGVYYLNFDTTIDPDDLSKPSTPSSTPVIPPGGDLNKFTYVKDEPVKIPVPVSSGGGAVSEYLVKFGPIQMDDTTGNADSAPTPGDMGSMSHYGAFLSVNSSPLGVTSFASLNGANASTASAYIQGPLNCLVDYGTGATAYILFMNGTTGSYVLNYSYRVLSNPADTTSPTTVATAANRTITVTADGWQPLSLPTGSAGIVPGSVSITRVFDRVAVTAPFSTSAANPFQYKLASSNIGGTGTTVNPGLLFFNPLGAGLSSSTAGGQQAFTAKVSYFVANWHILHDDVQVPTLQPNAAGLIPVKLSMNVLKRLEDANPDNTPYNGLYYPADPSAQNDIDAINLGQISGSPNAIQTPELDQGTLVHGALSPAGASYYVDSDNRTGTYRTGTIYVNASKLPAGSQLRVFYQADGDWAVGLRKASATYTPALPTSATDMTTGITTTVGTTAIQTRPTSIGTFGIDRSASSERLYFPHSDLNKSVLVSLQYTSGGVVVRVPPTQFTIDNLDTDTADSYVDSSNVRHYYYAYIDLTAGANASALSPADQAGIKADSSSTGWTVYGPITGVSVKTRVIWHDNNNTNNNWRSQDLDTDLTGPGS